MPVDPPTSTNTRPVRISEDEAFELYKTCSIHELGRRAHAVTQTLHPEDYRTYVVDRNINYSNYCSGNCSFCGFKADPPGTGGTRADRPRGYVLTLEELRTKIEELVSIGGTQILLQGGCVPAEVLPFSWYLDMLSFIRRAFPDIHIHAFSPPEIHAFHTMFGMPVADVLARLQDAGLDTIPGGGAEILVDRVRGLTAPAKINTDEYLSVMRAAHQRGMRTSITMMFGHVETIEERIQHLARIRALQDETGGFTAFICWTFQPGSTPLGQTPQFAAGTRQEPDGEHLVLAGAIEYLRMLAVARLYLDNIVNLQASWVTQGVQIGQLALFFGANDMGSVMMEENVVSAAGTTFRLSAEGIRQAITEAGWRPAQRDCYYGLVE